MLKVPVMMRRIRHNDDSISIVPHGLASCCRRECINSMCRPSRKESKVSGNCKSKLRFVSNHSLVRVPKLASLEIQSCGLRLKSCK